MRNLTVEKAISKITDSLVKCSVAFEITMLVRIHVEWTIEGYILQEIIKEMENDNYSFISIDINTNDRLNPRLDIIFGKDI